MGQCRTLDADVVMVITVHETTPFLCPFLFGTTFFPSHLLRVKAEGVQLN